MSNPDSKSTRLTQESLAVAERMQHATRCAAAGLEAVRCRLVFDLRGISTAVTPAEEICTKGGILRALRSLQDECTDDALESLALLAHQGRASL